MDRVIWKYQLATVARQTIDMPRGARILTVQLQANAITLWAMANPDARPARRVIEIHGTGERMRDPGLTAPGLSYVGTVQQRGFVWHVFDGGEELPAIKSADPPPTQT